jgi:hypothetical protein
MISTLLGVVFFVGFMTTMLGGVMLFFMLLSWCEERLLRHFRMTREFILFVRYRALRRLKLKRRPRC